MVVTVVQEGGKEFIVRVQLLEVLDYLGIARRCPTGCLLEDVELLDVEEEFLKLLGAPWIEPVLLQDHALGGLRLLISRLYPEVMERTLQERELLLVPLYGAPVAVGVDDEALALNPGDGVHKLMVNAVYRPARPSKLVQSLP